MRVSYGGILFHRKGSTTMISPPSVIVKSKNRLGWWTWKPEKIRYGRLRWLRWHRVWGSFATACTCFWNNSEARKFVRKVRSVCQPLKKHHTSDACFQAHFCVHQLKGNTNGEIRLDSQINTEWIPRPFGKHLTIAKTAFIEMWRKKHYEWEKASSWNS